MSARRDLPQKNLTFEVCRVEHGVLVQVVDCSTGARVRLEMTCAGTHAFSAILERCADTDAELSRDFDTTIGGRIF